MRPDAPRQPYIHGGAEYQDNSSIDKGKFPFLGNAADLGLSPLPRPVETWSNADLRAVMMASPACTQLGAPGRERAAAMVCEWFQQNEASAAPGGAVPAAAEGGTLAAGPASGSGGSGGPVHVSAYARGNVQVRAYDRSQPAR